MESLAAQIQRVELRNGMSIPMLVYGTGSTLMKSDSDGEIDVKLVDQIKTAINAGFTHFERAQAYHTEREFGNALV